jgi:hypothetical protein
VNFTSLKGDVFYAKGSPVQRSTPTTRFGGTMVRWRARVAGLEQAQ